MKVKLLSRVRPLAWTAAYQGPLSMGFSRQEYWSGMPFMRRQKEKGVTEDEMVGWHHRLNGHEFEQTPGDSEGQGSLACCSPWGCKQLDMTELLNHNKEVK